MKNCLIVLTSLVFIFVGTTSSLAQWTQTNGPFGGKTTAFIASDSDIFVTNYTDLFRSTNDGADWTHVPTDLPNFYNILSLAEIGTNLFAGTFDGGVFVSTDDGASWAAVNTGMTNHYVRVLAVSGTNLFAGTDGGGIFLTTNNGTSWTPVNDGLTSDSIHGLATYGTNLFAGTTSGVYRSTDSGENWTYAGLPNSNCDPNKFSFCYLDSILFCGINGSGVFRSTDNGTSWIQVGSSFPIGGVQALIMNDTNLFVGGYGPGIFRSTDFGVNWACVDFGLTDSTILCFGAGEHNLFAGSLNHGAYRSTDNGTSWTLSNWGMSLRVNCVAVNGTDLYAGTLGGGLFLTTDCGVTWTELALRTCYDFINSLVVTDTTIFVANSGSGGHGPDGGVALSTDNGKSWVSVSSDLANPNVGSLTISGPNLFAGGTNGVGVSRSSDNGASWVQVDSGLSNLSVWALASNDTEVFAGTDGGLFLSNNAGGNWTKIDIQVNSGLKFSRVHALAVRGDSLFACTDQGDYFSVDNGATWTPMPGQSQLDIQCLAATNSYLFAGTSRSVWKTPMSEVTAVKGLGRVTPISFNLEQNYPNPFNPSTTITYQLSKNSYVTLKVYDVLGREVALLVKDRQDAGNHSVKFNATTLPSGVYFYRLEAGTYHDTKKLLLLK